MVLKRRHASWFNGLRVADCRENKTDDGRGGFSLLELAIVLACLCIIVGAATPGLRKLNQEWTLWCGTWLLEGSLQWGRMHAISANSSLVFEVEPKGRRFYWADSESGQAYDNTIRDLPATIRIVSAPSRPLRYFPRGTAVPAGTFILRGEAGQYRVVVNPAGRIRVKRE